MSNNTNSRRIERDVETGKVAAEISVKDVSVRQMRPESLAPASQIGNPAPLGLLAFGLTTSESAVCSFWRSSGDF